MMYILPDSLPSAAHKQKVPRAKASTSHSPHRHGNISPKSFTGLYELLMNSILGSSVCLIHEEKTVAAMKKGFPPGKASST